MIRESNIYIIFPQESAVHKLLESASESKVHQILTVYEHLLRNALMPELCTSLCDSVRLFADTNKLACKTVTMFHVIASPEYRGSLMIITSSRHVTARTQANMGKG